MPSVAVSPLLPTDTVTVRADEIAAPAVAVTVTVFAPPPSLTLEGLADRLTAYVSSSASVILVPVTVRFVPLPDIVIVSSPSTALSFVGVSVKVPVPVVWLAAIVMLKLFTVA